jgi:hypothetical protein
VLVHRAPQKVADATASDSRVRLTIWPTLAYRRAGLVVIMMVGQPCTIICRKAEG